MSYPTPRDITSFYPYRRDGGGFYIVPECHSPRLAWRAMRHRARWYHARGFGDHIDVAALRGAADAMEAGIPAGFALRHAKSVAQSMWPRWEPVPGFYLRSTEPPLPEEDDWMPEEDDWI